jgi:NitT/TauT family transport system permease protein
MKVSGILSNKNVRMLIFFAVVVLFWQFLVWMEIWPRYLFPSPEGVFNSIEKGIESGTFIAATIASLNRMIFGFIAALFIGGLIGMLISQSKFLEDTAGQLILGLQTLPSVCWLPLAILWFGLNDKAMIFVVIAGAFCSIAMAIDAGIRNIQPIYVNAAKNMGAKNWELYRYVIFPAAMPTIISGIRQGWSFAWRSLMAGELLFFTVGLGQLLQVGRDLNDINQVVAVMMLIMFIGLAIERIVFGNIESRIRKKWGLYKG